MKTISTKIKDFKPGDTFLFHECIFQVISEPKMWTNHGGRIDPTPTYGCECRYLRPVTEHKSIDWLLRSYDWMQGIEEVTYSKIINQ
jgi:hypothetical protein